MGEKIGKGLLSHWAGLPCGGGGGGNCMRENSLDTGGKWGGNRCRTWKSQLGNKKRKRI